MASQQQSETSKQAGDGTGPLLNVNENGDEWDEARLEEGLKVLKEMHIQVCWFSILLCYVFGFTLPRRTMPIANDLNLTKKE